MSHPERARDHPREARVAGRWHRASPGRRLVGVLGALVVASTLVAAGAVSVAPHYGDGRPWTGLAVDDLRRSPDATGWTLDLAATLAPDAPRRCLNFWASPAVDGLVAVGTSVDLDFGDALGAPACRSYASEADSSRIGLVETATGTVRWVHDLARDVPDTDALSIPATQVVPSAGRVLVQTQTTGATVLAALDLRDGSLVESTRGRRDLPSVSVDSRGPLQLRTFSGIAGSGDRYQLVEASRLADPVWEGGVDSGSSPALLNDGALVSRGGETVFVDAATGRERPFAASPDEIAVPPVGSSVTTDDGRRVVAFGIERTRANGTVEALDDDGEAVWSRPTGGRRLAVTPSCVIVVTGGDTAAECLDPRDGTVRWTTDLGAPFAVEAVPGQRAADVFVVVQRSGGSRLLALDGADGHTRFSSSVGLLDDLAAAGRSVLYLQTDDGRSSGRDVAALDLHDGRPLWATSTSGTVAFWGGHLVRIDEQGVARRLVDTARVGATS